MIICRFCGKEEQPERWSNKSYLLLHRCCHECGYWIEIIIFDEILNRRGEWWRAVVVGGHHYRTHKGLNTPGHRWVVQNMATEQVVFSNDLWYQGKIPQRWRQQLPDNARFLSPAEVPNEVSNEV